MTQLTVKSVILEEEDHKSQSMKMAVSMLCLCLGTRRTIPMVVMNILGRMVAGLVLKASKEAPIKDYGMYTGIRQQALGRNIRLVRDGIIQESEWMYMKGLYTSFGMRITFDMPLQPTVKNGIK